MRKLSPILFGLFIAFNAQAAHRTYVAASGTDAGTCGPTTPCRTVDYAMGQTDSGGEVIITESGGYGSTPSGGITITKSISIIAQPGVFAALAPTTGFNGIEIATPGIKVVIKGLNINSRGGTNGINMTSGTSLLVEKSSISGFSSGNGLYVQTAATVNVVDAVIHDNSKGIRAGSGATVGIQGSKVFENTDGGIRISTSSAPTGITTTLNIVDTVVSGSTYCVDNVETSGNTGMINATRVTASKCSIGFYNGAGDKMTVSNSTSSDNTTAGFYNNGNLIVSGSTASNNGAGFRCEVGATFVSLGNNTVYGNIVNVNGSITTAVLE